MRISDWSSDVCSSDLQALITDQNETSSGSEGVDPADFDVDTSGSPAPAPGPVTPGTDPGDFEITPDIQTPQPASPPTPPSGSTVPSVENPAQIDDPQ